MPTCGRRRDILPLTRFYKESRPSNPNSVTSVASTWQKGMSITGEMYVTENNQETLDRVKTFGESLGFHSTGRNGQAAIFGISFANWISEHLVRDLATREDRIGPNAPDEFCVGLLQGYFDGDGYPRGKNTIQSNMLPRAKN